MKMLRANSDAPGYAGTLMEGLARFDSFVLANKADGIYIYAQNGVSAIPAGSYTGGKVTLVATGATTVYYTVDGTNPKQSATKATYSTSFTCTSGLTVLAYSVHSGDLDSPVLSFVAE